MTATQHYSDAIKPKYEEEKLKRIRQDGPAQFVDVKTTSDPKFSSFAADPWNDTPAKYTKPHSPDNHYKVAILGAGFGGILFAVRLMEKGGYKPEDIVLIDRSSNFGGTWYWNRYPGIMCDVDSMVYLPLLEETGYVPKHKYSYGDEIREHVNRLAQHWHLEDRALFKTEVKGASWDEFAKEWAVDVTENDDGEHPTPYTIRSDILIMTPGLLVRPKVPSIPGIGSFKGHLFHTSRWDYGYTGGSPTDWTMDNLSDKKVAIIGTGATAVQVVPQLAKWAKDLYVVQRTPAGVDVRGQHPISPENAQEITKEKNWQQKRLHNFISIISCLEDKPEVDMVADAWTALSTIRVVTGSPELDHITPENMEEYFSQIRDEDLTRTDRVRARVDEIVKNKEDAESLKAWYYTWCKRPCFHDDYLPTFNQANVHLVDTEGKGLEKVTETGIVAGGKEIQVDLIVFSTGFNFLASKSPATQAGIPVIGRGGLTLDDKWEKNLATLHGLVTRDFPNLFLASSAQSIMSPNQSYGLDIFATHAAGIIGQASKKAKAHGASKFTVEPTDEAEQNWTERIIAQSLPLAIVSDCTPSYYNLEGQLNGEMSKEEKLKNARGATWTRGPLDFVDFLTAWEEKGDLEGLELTVLNTENQ